MIADSSLLASRAAAARAAGRLAAAGARGAFGLWVPLLVRRGPERMAALLEPVPPPSGLPILARPRPWPAASTAGCAPVGRSSAAAA